MLAERLEELSHLSGPFDFEINIFALGVFNGDFHMGLRVILVFEVLLHGLRFKKYDFFRGERLMFATEISWEKSNEA
jgi:hypothetical protein